MDKRTKKQTIFMSSIPWKIAMIILIILSFFVLREIIFKLTLFWVWKVIFAILILLLDFYFIQTVAYRIIFLDGEIKVLFFRKRTIKFEEVRTIETNLDVGGTYGDNYCIEILLNDEKIVRLKYYLIRTYVIFTKIEGAKSKVEKIAKKIREEIGVSVYGK